MADRVHVISTAAAVNGHGTDYDLSNGFHILSSRCGSQYGFVGFRVWDEAGRPRGQFKRLRDAMTSVQSADSLAGLEAVEKEAD